MRMSLTSPLILRSARRARLAVRDAAVRRLLTVRGRTPRLQRLDLFEEFRLPARGELLGQVLGPVAELVHLDRLEDHALLLEGLLEPRFVRRLVAIRGLGHIEELLHHRAL